MMKNIVFDLGGVVFARKPQRCPHEIMEFFSFVAAHEMPDFWVEYDRGTATYDEVVRNLCEYNHCDEAVTRHNMQIAIDIQEEVEATKQLIVELKSAGYGLYVLSNMSVEFIEYLRVQDVYSYFDGEVISCEEHVVKPEAEIYARLLNRFNLTAAETMFIDDRRANVEAAAAHGIVPFHFNAANPDESCTTLRHILLQ